MRLRLRARSTLLLRLLRSLLLLSLLALLLALLLLRLRSGIGRRVATVLALAGAAESRLVVHRSALRVLAEVISLGIVPAKRSLLRRRAVMLAMGTLGAVLLAVVVVRISVLLVRGVVVGVVARSRAERASWLLGRRLRRLGSVVVERRLRNGGALLVERVDRLLRGRCGLLGDTMAESTVLLSAGDCGLGN